MILGRAILVGVLFTPALVAGPNWPNFRGPTGDGRSDATAAPLRWAEDKNVVWKTPIPGEGWSSPVVWGNQVWVTTATPDGTRLYAVCVDLASGKVLHNVKVFDVEKPEPKIMAASSYASPTPAIEDDRLYVHFGTYGTACLDTRDGKKLWERRDLTLDHKEGAGSSPLLRGDRLILSCDGQDVQYLIALDKLTGKTVWKTARSFDFTGTVLYMRKAYTTPLLVGGQLLSPGGRAAYAYDPATGKELWKVTYKGWSNVSNPVFGHGLVFINSGYGPQGAYEMLAVRADGKGDVTDSHIAWRLTRNVPTLSSPVLAGDWLYLCTDKGVASGVEAKTGKVLWQQRLDSNVSASPVLAAGRVYFCGEDGRTTVFRPGPTADVLAVNALEGKIKASPAVVGKSLILRTETHLYRIEE